MSKLKQKGQGLVEFALILPLLLLMFFGIIEFGRIFQAYITVQHAAREAARYAVTGQGGPSMAERVRAIKERAVEATAGLNLDHNKIDWREGEALDARSWQYMDEPNALLVQVFGPNGENDAGGPGERVLVHVVYNLQPLTPAFSIFSPRIALPAQMEMINEGFGPMMASRVGVLPPPLEPPPAMGPTKSTTLFTNAGGVKVTQYAIGDPIFVTVTDEDEDSDLNVRDTVAVTVTAPGDIETLFLTETEPSSGIFRAGLPSSGPGPSGNDILNTAVDDIITARYTDKDGGDSSSDTALMVEAQLASQSDTKFTDEGGAEVGDYNVGVDEIYVTVDDSDENLPSTQDWVYVTVIDSYTGDHEEWLLLTEMGSDTGRFRNTTGLLSIGSETATWNNGILETRKDSIITAQYIDDDDGADISSDTATMRQVCPVVIEEPVYADHTTVTVRGSPDDTIQLWDLTAGGTTIGVGTVQGSDCTASVDIIVGDSLVDGHIIAAISSLHPSFDLACVGVDGCWATPTPTPTPTATPSTQYMVLDPDCLPADQAATITVHGFNWDHNRDINISWDTTPKATVLKAASWTQDISIEASEATTGTHTVEAQNTHPQQPQVYSQTVDIPCPPTPTPPVVRPDLVITSFTVSPDENNIKAYESATFTAVIENQGQADALSVFWVDLFVDPSPAPPTAGQSNGDVVWEAASFLGVGETTTVTLDYTFTVTGTHMAYGYVDTRRHIDETDEDNNVSLPLRLEVGAGTPSTPATLTSEPLCSDVGASKAITVSGESWPTNEGPIGIHWDGQFKDSISPQVNWSHPITISASEAITGTHVISASTGIISATSTYYIPCSLMGSIDGYTWISVGGDILPQGRVDVSCKDSGDNLIAQTTSNDSGYYDLGYVPPGTYVVKGQTYIDEVLYMGIQVVEVSEGSMVRVPLLLMPQY